MHFLQHAMSAETPQTLPLDVALQQAIAHHQAGRLSEAEDIYRAILHAAPGQQDANHNLGVLAGQVGQHAAGLPHLKAAFDADPGNGQYVVSYANGLLAAGRAGEALGIIQAAQQRGLNSPAVSALRQNAESAAKAGAAKGHEPAPGEIEPLVALFNAGRYVELESRARLLVEQYPRSGIGWNLLGACLQVQGKDSVPVLQKATELSPGDADAHNNLGNALKAIGQLDEAVKSFGRALAIRPEFAEAHSNLGNALQDLGQLDDAVTSFRRALTIKPDLAEASFNLGNALQDLRHFDDSVANYRRALEIKPDYVEAHYNLGNALGYLGCIEKAIDSYRRALEIKPDFFQAQGTLIFYLDMMPGMGLEEQQAERKKYEEVHGAPLWREVVHENDRSPGRRLRIGYVSADLRAHSASKTFAGILTGYDRTQFEVYAYSNFGGKEDPVTERFRQGVTVWRNIGHLSDEEAAELIREDRIDILVDLSGHSAGNRLLVFARKPAPIQITGWGYGSSTGLRAMDVFFTDEVLVPPEDKKYFREEVRYQASAWGSYAIEEFPEVNELPGLSGGGVTFGSFNRLAKVSEQAYRAWVEVLKAVPGSRLLLKTAELNDTVNRERVVRQFTDAGVSAERIILQEKTPWAEHVQAYNQVDVALDPFPHGGGVTTLEGLMMGVPVVTLRWPTIAGRVSASIMTVLGMTEWIAETPEEYVELAMRKARDLQSLAVLRQQLRGTVTSVLGDQAAYVRSVELEYRQLWTRWCAGDARQG